MSPLLCNTTDGYGVFGFHAVVLGALGLIGLISVVVTIMMAIIAGSQWAIAPFLVATTALLLLLVTWWTDLGTAGWNEYGPVVAGASLILGVAMAALGRYMVDKAY